MSEHKRLSIITPVYNTMPEYLQALARSLGDAVGDVAVEWLLIDDGSESVGTLDCLRMLAREPHVRLERNARADGAAGARNHGASIAAARRLMFLDSDDLLEPGSVEKLFSCMEQNPRVRWLAGDFKQFHEQPPLVDKAVRSDSAGVTAPVHWPDAVNRLVFETLFNQGSYIVDRDLFWEAGGFDEKFQIGEDWLLWMRVAIRGELYRCPTMVLWQRRGHRSIMSGVLTDTAEIVAPYLAARRDPQFSDQRRLLRWRIFRLYRLLSQRNEVLGYRVNTIRFAWLAAAWAINEPRQWMNALRALVGLRLR